MPDTRTHRGAHPEDGALFGPDAEASLRRGAADLGWLLDRGYGMRSSLALVGDRHNLTQRQRIALARSICSATERTERVAREIPLADIAGRELWIDGYNLLITAESALGGGVILHGRDGCFRDLASLHGTYRHVEETTPALTLLGETIQARHPTNVHWILDRPVSNSGRLKERILTIAGEHQWPWHVELEFSPDAVLVRVDGIVATSDSAILDRCVHWTNIAAAFLGEHARQAFLVDFNGVSPASAAPAAQSSMSPNG
jgi:hypothetical protein